MSVLGSFWAFFPVGESAVSKTGRHFGNPFFFRPSSFSGEYHFLPSLRHSLYHLCAFEHKQYIFRGSTGRKTRYMQHGLGWSRASQADLPFPDALIWCWSRSPWDIASPATALPCLQEPTIALRTRPDVVASCRAQNWETSLSDPWLNSFALPLSFRFLTNVLSFDFHTISRNNLELSLVI